MMLWVRLCESDLEISSLMISAHVYAYGKEAPAAEGVIHLGATSCFVSKILFCRSLYLRLMLRQGD